MFFINTNACEIQIFDGIRVNNKKKMINDEIQFNYVLIQKNIEIITKINN